MKPAQKTGRLGPALLVTLLLVSLAAVTAPRTAAGALPWGDRPIVIRAGSARAVISRAPFRIVIIGAGGAGALREVAGARPAPQAEPLTRDPLPPGIENPGAPPLYAPLSFTVGAQRLLQYQGGLFGGNLMSGTRQGTRYAARNVISARALTGGIRLIISTNDPSGRRLVVLVRAHGRGAIEVRTTAVPARGVSAISDSFGSGYDEHFFGLGGRHDGLDQRGRLVSSFVAEENINGLTGLGRGGGGRWLYPNGPGAAYFPQAELLSSRGYGLLLANSQLARFRLDSDRPTAWNVEVSSPSLDYVVVPGGQRRAIAGLTALGGRQPPPPRWALGPMLDRLVKNFGETPQDYQAQVSEDLRNIVRYRLPLSAYRIEGWGFPNADNDGLSLHTYTAPAEQAQVISVLRSRHIHPLVYLRPWITPGSEPIRRGLVVRRADGSPYETTTTTGRPIALLDFTNPAAVRFWQHEVTRAFDLGADGFMQDFGEEVLLDMHFADGETGATMHNRYLVLYARATRQALTRYERAHSGRQLWFFDRAGYSGLPGTAAYDGGNFPGDETTDWSRSSGIASLAPDMLSRAVGGAFGFGTDIGGYYDITTPPTTKELFLRWAEWAALSPVFRLHGSGLAGTHTPWSYDAQTVRVYEALSRLHLRAVPLILSLWRQADRTGIPVTRPLWMIDGSPGARRAQDQEWLLGEDVLVAPVVIVGASSRAVYFPRGCWRAPDTGEVHRGPVSATVGAPLTRLPYFVRCGRRPL